MSMSRHYKNNDIFPKMRADRLDFYCSESPQATGRSVGPYAVGLYQPAGWLAAAAHWAAKSSCSGPMVRNSLFVNNLMSLVILFVLLTSGLLFVVSSRCGCW